MKVKSCCFTGHRNVAEKDVDKIFTINKIIIEILINEKNVTNFKVGGARGFDTIVSLVILQLKKQYPNIKLTLILPCENQDINWFEKDKFLYNIVLRNADEITYISKKYTPNCMLKRNDKLLENSDYCLCYLKENTMKGGTFYTVSRAKKNNIKVYNINDYI